MKNCVLLATTYQDATEVLNWCEKKGIQTATVEAEYGEECAEGTYATLAHHTTEHKMNPAPCVRDEIKPFKDGVIVVSHIDLDTLGGISILEGMKLEHPSFWNSESIIDTKGYIGVKEIPEDDELVMKAFLGLEKTKVVSFSQEKIGIENERVFDVTERVYELLEVLHYLLSLDKDSNYRKYGLMKFNQYLKNLTIKSLYQDKDVRIFKTQQPQHYLIHKEDEIEYRTCITLNERTGAIILSDISESLDCKVVMQEVFGEKAGGQFRVAGTPRHKRYTLRDVKKLCRHLNECYQFKINIDEVSSKGKKEKMTSS